MRSERSPGLSAGARLIVGLPFLWWLILLLLPVAIVIKISFAQISATTPPYTELISLIEGKLRFAATLDNYLVIFTSRAHALAYLTSIKLAVVSTVLCLLIGYPVAWGIYQVAAPQRRWLLLLVVLPAWVSPLVRAYAWVGLMDEGGFVNQALLSLGLLAESRQFLRTQFAICIGMVYSYLPLMILSIHAALARIDRRLIEAALDLGATRLHCFWHVILPLSYAGIVAGSLLVAIPATGEFVIPALLGGADTPLVGTLLWEEFFTSRDWPGAAALSVVLMLLLLAPFGAWYHYRSAAMNSIVARGAFE